LPQRTPRQRALLMPPSESNKGASQSGEGTACSATLRTTAIVSTDRSANNCRLEPLSAARYRIQFTADAALKDKLERAKHLLSHVNPSGDLAVIVDRALDLLLTDLEKKKLAKTDRPKRGQSAKPKTITRAARREVFARDGLRCSFVSADGKQCRAKGLLEIDHIQARALGGGSDLPNLRVLCRAHNRLMAEQAFGRVHIERSIQFSQRRHVQNLAGELNSTHLPEQCPSESTRRT
jgi:5-methylcytosine-specific restriction endonuclease McrA